MGFSSIDYDSKLSHVLLRVTLDQNVVLDANFPLKEDTLALFQLNTWGKWGSNGFSTKKFPTNVGILLKMILSKPRFLFIIMVYEFLIITMN